MNLKWFLARLSSGGGLLALLTLATGGLFKLAAFAREAFIASHFGLSNFTDAYFAFQQFPLMLVTFMFGAFALAFAPAYAAEKRSGGPVTWLPGLLLYGSALGLLLTLVSAGLAPWLVPAFTSSPSAHSAATLLILSCSFAPVIWLGIWAGTTIANGHNVKAMFVAGLPYLSMTILLIGIYALGKLDDLTLPLSFLAGFGVIGVYTFFQVIATECQKTDLRAILETWRMPAFRRFLHQLTASSIENLGFSINQLLLVFFLAKAGTGAVSANTCAMRVGMLGFSLLGQPLAQLVQAKLCAAQKHDLGQVFRKWLLVVACVVCVFAAILYLCRVPITSLVYLRGKFSVAELDRVIEIMPAWLAYFVVASLNAIVARYLFAAAQGGSYVRRQLCGYLMANVIRVAFWGRLSAPMVVWCSVFAEGCALVVSLHSCFQSTETTLEAPEMAVVQEV
jgi:peptidoglycan biosynthesis protein MviN/MurJ (putative lipid II flippase)